MTAAEKPREDCEKEFLAGIKDAKENGYYKKPEIKSAKKVEKPLTQGSTVAEHETDEDENLDEAERAMLLRQLEEDEE